MTISPRKVALRYLEAGTLQPIPKLAEAVYDYIVGWSCAYNLSDVETALQQARGSQKVVADLGGYVPNLRQTLQDMWRKRRNSPPPLDLLGDYAPRMGFARVQISPVLGESRKPTFLFAFQWVDEPNAYTSKDPYSLQDVEEILTGWFQEHKKKASKLPSIRKVHQYLQQHQRPLSGGGGAAEVASARIPVDYTGWKYLREYAAKLNLSLAEVEELFKGILPDINVVLADPLLRYRGIAALWNDSQQTLAVSALAFSPHDVREKVLRDLLESYRVDIQHEVIHVAQTVLQAAAGQARAGTPHPETFLEYNVSGNPAQSSEDRQEHALRDIEHQTRLADEIEFFKSLVRGLPSSRQREVFQWWVGMTTQRPPLKRLPKTPSKFFTLMKQHRPDRYRRTVSEFYKVVF